MQKPYLRLVPIVAIALLSLVTACSKDNDPSPQSSSSAIDQIRDATFAAGSAAYSGEKRFADGTSGTVEGASQAEPPAGEVSVPVSTPTGPQDVKFVWTDGTIYVQRAVISDGGAVSSIFRMGDDPPWIRVGYQPLTTTLFDGYDPFRLLERLSTLQVDAVAQGTEKVGDAELQRFTVDMSGVAVSPGGATTIELLTDGDQRLEVVRLVGADTTEYRLTDFGTEVSPTAPPEDQIGTSAGRPQAQPVGPYEVVAQGTAEGAGTWKLLRAPGPEGLTCFRLDTDAPLDPVAATQTDGGTCVDPFDPSAAPEDQIQVVVDAGGGAPFDALVAAVAPGTSNALIRFTDGTPKALAVDPGGFIVWVGPKAPLAVTLEVTAPDGTGVTCGPGQVSTYADLADLPPQAQATLDRSPWLCIVP